MRSETDQWTGRDRQEPETIPERIAWALCMHDNATADGGYLNDEELRGLEALLRAMARRCGNERAEADFLGVPVASIARYIYPLKNLAEMERMRRDDNKSPLLAAHLTAAYWPDYLKKGEVAFSIALEDARVAKNVRKKP